MSYLYLMHRWVHRGICVTTSRPHPLAGSQSPTARCQTLDMDATWCHPLLEQKPSVLFGYIYIYTYVYMIVYARVYTYVIKIYRDTLGSFVQWRSVFANHSNLFVVDHVNFGYHDAVTNLAKMMKQSNNFERYWITLDMVRYPVFLQDALKFSNALIFQQYCFVSQLKNQHVSVQEIKFKSYLVGGLEHFSFSKTYGIILPIDELIFFKITRYEIIRISEVLTILWGKTLVRRVAVIVGPPWDWQIGKKRFVTQQYKRKLTQHPCPRVCARCNASDDRRSRCSAFVCRGT